MSARMKAATQKGTLIPRFGRSLGGCLIIHPAAKTAQKTGATNCNITLRACSIIGPMLELTALTPTSAP